MALRPSLPNLNIQYALVGHGGLEPGNYGAQACLPIYPDPGEKAQ